MLDSDLFYEEVSLNKNYRKIRRLGSGGDGVVYLVCHLPTEQLRAAKCLKAEQPGKRLRELALMKKLNHPALPKILDVLEAEGRIWLIMEYISGRCITEISGEETSPSQFFSVARQLAEVLIYLHTRPVPILHLDIKPSNVLIRMDGSLVLIDFGAAVFLTDGDGRGHYGTPGFAAPEQKDINGKIDERTDVYGFGALLYYYLFHDIPEPGKRKQTGREGTLKKLHVYHLLQQCLCEDPGDRFEDCKGLHRAVCTAERRYCRGKKLRRTSGALGLLLTVFLFALFRSENGGDFSEQLSLQKEQAYVQLLEQAEGLGFSQAAECYGEAAELCPDRAEWCMALLERVGEDYLFERQEEKALKELLYMVPPGGKQTFLEEQKGNPVIYGELAYRLGLLYWYFYEDTGGKSAAASWFEQAVSVQSQADSVPGWLESAKVHADIGKYYETLGRKDENGVYLEDYGIYWRDLKRLWILEDMKKENAGIYTQIADEMLACVILHAYEIYEMGESFEEIKQTLGSLEQFIRSGSMPDDDQRKREQQCRAAWAAAERVYKKGERRFEEE